MEIKELHIRNIASIECADIDFSKGLNDGITGTPASIFLISGDTGAGKSIILDGISMALYKNTPRIEGVNDTKKNEFVDNEGESIRVASIEQYTRLGIGFKDECYSEVAFIGNDDIEYRARLTLGLSQGNTDKTTGKRPIKHRTPRWEVKKGTDDWTTDSVEKTILQAIGLSFEQFGRMAMLAQGQFATFLTGKKEEREAILEQLTNTEHFSDYGKAIKRLFDKAQEDERIKQAAFDSAARFVLPDDKVAELQVEEKRISELDEAVVKELREIGFKLEQVGIIVNNRSGIARAQDEKSRIREIKEGDDYKSRRALVADWDSTVDQRQLYANLKTGRQRAIDAAKQEVTLKEHFVRLSNDLAYRREQLSALDGLVNESLQKATKITELKAERNKLNPQEIQKTLEELRVRRTDLGHVSEYSQRLSKQRSDARSLSEKIESEEKLIKEKEKLADNAKLAFEKAQTEANNARALLTGMQTSVQEMMINLRRQLVEGHAENCPLCGQHIDHILPDDKFKGIVTPYEARCREADAKRDEAQKAFVAINKELSGIDGEQKNRKSQLKELNDDIQNEDNRLNELILKTGLDATKPLGAQVESALAALIATEEKLKQDMAQITSLTDTIDSLGREKEKIDVQITALNSNKQTVDAISGIRAGIIKDFAEWDVEPTAQVYECVDINSEWNQFNGRVVALLTTKKNAAESNAAIEKELNQYYAESGKTEADLERISLRRIEVDSARRFVDDLDSREKDQDVVIKTANGQISDAKLRLGIEKDEDIPDKTALEQRKSELDGLHTEYQSNLGGIKKTLTDNKNNIRTRNEMQVQLNTATEKSLKWKKLNRYFGGTRFRTLVQTYILRPLLNNANIYLSMITDRYMLTCSEDNEQLAILVLDHYNKDQVRSVTVLSGGERFMISLALSLALSSLNRPDMNVNILFIDEGFGTLDEKSLDSVMETLEKLQNIPGQGNRRVGIISHREELEERIGVKIKVVKKGEGRSMVEIANS